MRLSVKFLLAISIFSFGCSGAENRSVEAKNPTKFWWQISTVTSDIATVQTKNSWLVNTAELTRDDLDFSHMTANEILVFPDNWKPQVASKASAKLRQDTRSVGDLLDEALKRAQKPKPEGDLY